MWASKGGSRAGKHGKSSPSSRTPYAAGKGSGVQLTSRVFPLGSRGAYQLPEWPADKRIWGPHRPPCKITSAAHGTGRGARDYESHLLRSAILRRDLTTRTAFPRGPRLGRSCLLNKLMGRFGPRRTGPAGPLLLPRAKLTTKPPASRYTPNRPGPPRWLRCRPRGDDALLCVARPVINEHTKIRHKSEFLSSLTSSEKRNGRRRQIFEGNERILLLAFTGSQKPFARIPQQRP